MNILFLCTGNSARSILGEVIFNDFFSNYGSAFSAGSHPVGKVNPVALETLENHKHLTQKLTSKDVAVFAQHGAELIDVVVSVCDHAAQDCLIWPAQNAPKRVHWSLPDPASVEDEFEKKAAFEETYNALKTKISELVVNL